VDENLGTFVQNMVSVSSNPMTYIRTPWNAFHRLAAVEAPMMQVAGKEVINPLNMALMDAYLVSHGFSPVGNEQALIEFGLGYVEFDREEVIIGRVMNEPLVLEAARRFRIPVRDNFEKNWLLSMKDSASAAGTRCESLVSERLVSLLLPAVANATLETNPWMQGVEVPNSLMGVWEPPPWRLVGMLLVRHCSSGWTTS